MPETEVHVEEVIDALTRFANNAIHQNVAEHGVTVSIRTVVDGRTARVTTNRLDEDSLRAALEICLSLAASQPKDPHLLPMPGKQKYRKVQPIRSCHRASHGGRARPRRANALAIWPSANGQVAAGIFASGQSQTLHGQFARACSRTYRQTQAEFSVTMQQGSAASWAKANAADVAPIRSAWRSRKPPAKKPQRAQNPIELAPGRYTVILEPAAVARSRRLSLLRFFRDRRLATSVPASPGAWASRSLARTSRITDDVYHPEQLGAAI